jgi:hypothetical protein
LTETKVTPEAVEQFRKEKAAAFVSWARRPAPRGAPAKLQAEPDAFEDDAKGAAQ